MLTLRLPDGVRDPNDIWLMSMAGKQQHVAAPQVCPFPDSLLFGTFADSYLGHQTGQAVEDGFIGPRIYISYRSSNFWRFLLANVPLDIMKPYCLLAIAGQALSLSKLST